MDCVPTRGLIIGVEMHVDKFDDAVGTDDAPLADALRILDVTLR